MFLRLDDDNVLAVCQLAKAGGFDAEAVANEILREHFRKLAKPRVGRPRTVSQEAVAEAGHLREIYPGMTWKEIGEKVGVNPNTLRGRHSEGKR